MSFIDFIFGLFAFKTVFDKKPVPKTDKPHGLPWMGGDPHANTDRYAYIEPHFLDSDIDEDRYDELREKIEELEDRLDDLDGNAPGFENSLDKVSELLGREHLSEDDLDLVERALENVESGMDDYEDRQDLEPDELAEDYPDEFDWEHDDIDDELDDAIDEDLFDDYNYRWDDPHDDD